MHCWACMRNGGALHKALCEVLMRRGGGVPKEEKGVQRDLHGEP
jgi:hypothetical protein